MAELPVAIGSYRSARKKQNMEIREGTVMYSVHI